MPIGFGLPPAPCVFHLKVGGVLASTGALSTGALASGPTPWSPEIAPYLIRFSVAFPVL